MGIIRKMLQANCTHTDLAIVTINYNSETNTCTAIDKEIICNDCGKVIVPKNIFWDMYNLLMSNK